MHARLRAQLLDWYAEHKRALPWRQTRDPYAIWVSEVMLQQTRVDTVIPYYERFMARFPTASSLAAADSDALMSMWSGLGYYRRARLLHEGVREVVARYGGDVPKDPDARRALSGVGRYTAGAIGSIAFDRPEPIVDGNVARVLSRVFGVDARLGTTASDKQLWQLATDLVEGADPGAFNQAMMELGALICTKRNPGCESCPVQAQCNAHATDRTDVLPVPRLKKRPRQTHAVAVVARRGDKTWMQRGDDALFGGLWTVPWSQLQTNKGHRQAAGDALSRSGATGRIGTTAQGSVEHVLTHRRFKVKVYRATHVVPAPETTGRWVDSAQLEQLGVSRFVRKILSADSAELSVLRAR